MNSLQSLNFDSYIELEKFCRENKLLIKFSDNDLKYIFENYINCFQNESKEVAHENLISPYQYTL